MDPWLFHWYVLQTRPVLSLCFFRMRPSGFDASTVMLHVGQVCKPLTTSFFGTSSQLFQPRCIPSDQVECHPKNATSSRPIPSLQQVSQVPNSCAQQSFWLASRIFVNIQTKNTNFWPMHISSFESYLSLFEYKSISMKIQLKESGDRNISCQRFALLFPIYSWTLIPTKTVWDGFTSPIPIEAANSLTLLIMIPLRSQWGHNLVMIRPFPYKNSQFQLGHVQKLTVCLPAGKYLYTFNISMYIYECICIYVLMSSNTVKLQNIMQNFFCCCLACIQIRFLFGARQIPWSKVQHPVILAVLLSLRLER